MFVSQIEHLFGPEVPTVLDRGQTVQSHSEQSFDPEAPTMLGRWQAVQNQTEHPFKSSTELDRALIRPRGPNSARPGAGSIKNIQT